MSEILTQNWIDDGDLSAGFTSIVIPLPNRYASVIFQGTCTGTPAGTMSVEVSVQEDEWVTLEGCEDISEDLGVTGYFYFIVPYPADYASEMRLKWVSGPSSGGTIDVAMRLMPL